MTAQQLATALVEATALEQRAREAWRQAPELTDREAALVVVRHATATARALEKWIAARAVRAAA